LDLLTPFDVLNIIKKKGLPDNRIAEGDHPLCHFLPRNFLKFATSLATVVALGWRGTEQ
jgi:hypothetical protein